MIYIGEERRVLEEFILNFLVVSFVFVFVSVSMFYLVDVFVIRFNKKLLLLVVVKE